MIYVYVGLVWDFYLSFEKSGGLVRFLEFRVGLYVIVKGNILIVSFVVFLDLGYGIVGSL